MQGCHSHKTTHFSRVKTPCVGRPAQKEPHSISSNLDRYILNRVAAVVSTTDTPDAPHLLSMMKCERYAR
jgi:hypothetical protein